MDSFILVCQWWELLHQDIWQCDKANLGVEWTQTDINLLVWQFLQPKSLNLFLKLLSLFRK